MIGLNLNGKAQQALIGAALALGILSAPARAVDTPSTPAATAPDADYVAGRQAIQKKDWRTAIARLSASAKRDDGNADVHNLLGYAYRNAGQMDPAFKHYARALALDAAHKGAHEYVGEAYLLTNNLPKAEEHLRVLRNLCPSGCEEYDDLRKAVAAYRQKTGQR